MPDPITLAMAAIGIIAILLAARFGWEGGRDAGYVEGYRAGAAMQRVVTRARRDPMVPDTGRAPGEWTEECGK